MQNKKAPVALSIAELTRLLEAAKKFDVRFYVMCIIAVCHGLRASEVIALRRKNFTLAGGVWSLTVQRLKGSHETTQPLLPNTNHLFDESAVVAEFVRDLKPNDFLFRNKSTDRRLSRFAFNMWMEEIGKLADIHPAKCHPHALKHSTGVLMRLSGAAIEEIADTLGHKSLTSTLQYLRVTEEQVVAARQKMFNTTAKAAAAGR